MHLLDKSFLYISRLPERGFRIFEEKLSYTELLLELF